MCNDVLQTPKTQPILLNYNNDIHHKKTQNFEMIDNADLGSIDEEEFEQQMIHQQNHFEFMNIDAINRQYARLQILYKVRGLYHLILNKTFSFN